MKTILALVGAAIGGTLGFFATAWVLQNGYYTVLLPAAFAGLGTLLGRVKGISIPLALAAAAFCFTYFTQWRYFKPHYSFSEFIQEIQLLRPLTHVMAVVGGLIAFWVPFRNRDKRKPYRRTDA